MYLKRLVEKAADLDCWVTVYPSIRTRGVAGGDATHDLYFYIDVTDENDVRHADAQGLELEEVARNVLTVLELAEQRGAFE